MSDRFCVLGPFAALQTYRLDRGPNDAHCDVMITGDNNISDADYADEIAAIGSDPAVFVRTLESTFAHIMLFVLFNCIYIRFGL